MQEEVVLPCCAVWERCAVDLSPEGLAGLDSKKWETVNNTAQSQGQVSTDHVWTLVSNSLQRDLLVKEANRKPPWNFPLKKAADGRLEVTRHHIDNGRCDCCCCVFVSMLWKQE